MVYFLAFLVICAIVGLIALGIVCLMQFRQRELLAEQLLNAQAELENLAPFKDVVDAAETARRLRNEAEAELARASEQAARLVDDATDQATAVLTAADDQASQLTRDTRERVKAQRAEAQAILDSATHRAATIVEQADARAQAIAGTAYDAVKNADAYKKTAAAMRNIVNGYGDAYLVPSHSLLDDLGEEFSHTAAGHELKRAREYSKVMVSNGTAADCSYAEQTRKELAARFILDAFNGKADSILSRARHDNYGSLAQEIKDAFQLVNHNGRAFRDARVVEAYLDARLEELRWAVVVHELKLVERDEQRRIREQIREEEKARREYEKAQREARKEEKMLREAMAKAQAMFAAATEEQKAAYEEQLKELEGKLVEAAERNLRAMSLAEQTRRGHVYIISNIGSFGDEVYKIGLTRRLEPLDRVRELGDSSVPFEFDVHAMIFSENAPALEAELHKHFALGQINKVNHRKEFFRLNLAHLRTEIETLGYQAHWTMTADAAEYRESQAIERAFANDPAARDAWLNRQLVLEDVEAAETVGAEE